LFRQMALVQPLTGRPGMTGDLNQGQPPRADGEAIVGYESRIAVISFADEAITDPNAAPRKRVTCARGKQGEVTWSPSTQQAPEKPVGWAWLSARTNSLTGDRDAHLKVAGRVGH